LCMRMSNSLMVVLVIDEHYVLSFKCEREAPVAVHRHRPMAFQFAMQGMQLPSGRVHISCRPGIVQREQLFAKPFGMAGLDFGFRSRPEEQFDSLVTKAFDHLCSV
jgi:hypothetical protein